VPRLSIVPALLVALLALAAAGCGSSSSSSNSGDSTSASSSGAAAGTLSVSEKEFSLTPANPKVDKAGKVTISVTNDGTTTHALAVNGPSGKVQTPALQPGQSKTLVVDFSKAGSYEWFCPIDGHKGMGMDGHVTVGSGGGGSSSGTSSPKGSGY
jgi:uncharacterized cupredoxin-like copper-binding protein